MKIALLHYAAPPVVGGVESVLAHHARLFTENGHEVRILCGRGASFDPRIPVHTEPLFDSRHPRLEALKAALDAGHVPADFAILRAEIFSRLAELTAGCEVLIAHNVASLHKNLALTAALHDLTDIRRILWHHDLAWTTPRYRHELHAGYPWDLLCTAWPGVTQVVVSAFRQSELSALMGLPAAHIHVIPNGVDMAAFLKLETRTLELLSQLPLLEAEPLLLLPVRLTPRKNIELALRVLAELRGGPLPGAQLLITGPEGPHNPANAAYKARLLALRAGLNLSQAAHLLAELTSDFLPDPVIADFYRLADALILPSHEEGFGIPIIEAGFSHLPVFCSDIPVLRELGGPTLHYFDPHADPGAVAGLIARTLTASPAYAWASRARARYAWSAIYTRQLAPLLERAGPVTRV